MPKPLSAVAILVLSSLAESSRHAYALMQDVRDRSSGEVAPGPTSLYRIVWRLVDDELIAETEARPTRSRDDERRRYFQIPALGRRTLSAELAKLERLVRAARSSRPAKSRG